jgi:hypothetical protein
MCVPLWLKSLLLWIGVPFCSSWKNVPPPALCAHLADTSLGGGVLTCPLLGVAGFAIVVRRPRTIYIQTHSGATVLAVFRNPGGQGGGDTSQRLARLTSADAVRSGRAQALGLTWPAPSVKRSVGKPSRQKRWTERLYQAIVRDEHVPPGLTAVVPPWWFGGSLLQPDDPVDLVQAASQELQPEEVLPEAPDPPPLLGNNPLHHKLALAKARAICEC